jgi:ketosteroid isomerase-like protein
MSQANVESVRRGFAAFNEGDLEAAAKDFDPDVVWIPYLGRLGGGDVNRSRASIVAMWSDLKSHFSDVEIEPVELIDCGDQVVAVVEVRGMGSLSGAAIEERWAQVYWFRDGLVRRMEVRPTREEALAAASREE